MYDIRQRKMTAEDTLNLSEKFNFAHPEPIRRFVENYEAAHHPRSSMWAAEPRVRR